MYKLQANGQLVSLDMVGEWHSHPSGYSTNSSVQDTFLLEYLALELNRDGLPGLMLIVGDEDEQWFLGEVKE